MVQYFEKIINTPKKWYILLFVLSFVLYGNTLNNDYTIDDHYVANNNDQVKKGIKGIPEIFSSHYVENENNSSYEYRPLVKTTFAIEYEFFKNNAAISHFINILLYFLSLYLLYHFLGIFIDKSNFHIQLIVILFAVLPVHTEVVASLKNRDILLCFDFVLISIISLNKFITDKKIYFLIAGYICVALAFLSKIEAFPFIILTPVLFAKKYGFSLKNLSAAFLVFCIGYFSVVITKGYFLNEVKDSRIFYNYELPSELVTNYSLRISTAFNVLGYYLKNLLFPSNLSCYYGLHTIPLRISIYFFIGLAFGLLLLFLFIKNIKRKDDIWTGVVLFVFPVSIYLQVIKLVPGIVADRFTFFTSVGYVIIVGWIFDKLYHRYKIIAGNNINFISYTVLLCLCIYSVNTIRRNSDWKNNLTLYQADVKKWPTSVKLNILFANEIIENINKQTPLIKADQYEQYIKTAYSHLKKAYSLDSTYYNSLNTLAFINLNFYNNPQEATYWLYKAQRHDSINYEIPLNMCLAYMRINNPDSVEKYASQTLKMNQEIKPQLFQALNNYFVSTKLKPKNPSFLPVN